MQSKRTGSYRTRLQQKKKLELELGLNLAIPLRPKVKSKFLDYLTGMCVSVLGALPKFCRLLLLSSLPCGSLSLCLLAPYVSLS